MINEANYKNMLRRNTITARWNNLISIAFGIAALFVFIIVLIAGASMASFAALAVIGIAACVVGNAHSATRFGWTNPTYWLNPFNIIGMVLGVAALVLVALTFSGITAYMAGSIALAAIILVKVGLNIRRNAILQ